MNKVIGLGGFAVSNQAGDVLTTYALGSCVGVTAYSYGKKAAGLIHIVLPDPADGHGAGAGPAYYASTGIPLLIDNMRRLFGCTPEELVIRLYGGAEAAGSRDLFRVGPRNIMKTEAMLAGLHLNYKPVDTGGCYSRTIALDAATGRVTVHKQPFLMKN